MMPRFQPPLPLPLPQVARIFLPITCAARVAAGASLDLSHAVVLEQSRRYVRPPGARPNRARQNRALTRQFSAGV
jgi:hypothetical protein